MDGKLFDRGKALEDRFFNEKDKQLLEQMKAKMEAAEIRKRLGVVCGIEDDSVLDALVAQEISAESLLSVSLIPLIAVAWADGKMDEKEKLAILQSAGQAGIDTESPAYQVLERWLTEKPESELFDSWKAYIGAMKTTMEEATLSQLKNSVILRAKKIAEAAGGILGFAKTSDKEAQVIAELEQAFD